MSESAPVRIQMKRTKGWRMPPNTVKVDRTTKWGNPFTAEGAREAGYLGDAGELSARCVSAFRVWLGRHWQINWAGSESAARRGAILEGIAELRGKNLACWCPLDKPCHADVLLELANAPDL